MTLHTHGSHRHTATPPSFLGAVFRSSHISPFFERCFTVNQPVKQGLRLGLVVTCDGPATRKERADFSSARGSVCHKGVIRCCFATSSKPCSLSLQGGEGTCCSAGQLELDPWDPRGRKEPAPRNCPLTSAHVPSCLCTHTCTHTTETNS